MKHNTNLIAAELANASPELRAYLDDAMVQLGSMIEAYEVLAKGYYTLKHYVDNDSNWGHDAQGRCLGRFRLRAVIAENLPERK